MRVATLLDSKRSSALFYPNVRRLELFATQGQKHTTFLSKKIEIPNFFDFFIDKSPSNIFICYNYYQIHMM